MKYPRKFKGLREWETKYLVHIVAVDQNLGIGWKDKLLFRIPEDLKRFKELTTGMSVVVGTKTLTTLPDLKNRTIYQFKRDIRNKSPKAEGAINDAESIKKIASKFTSRSAEPIFIIGGGEVYKHTLPHTSVIVLTRVLTEAKNVDTFYPNFLEDERKPLYSSIGKLQTCEKTGLKYQFEIYAYNELHLRHFLQYKHQLYFNGRKR